MIDPAHQGDNGPRYNHIMEMPDDVIGVVEVNVRRKEATADTISQSLLAHMAPHEREALCI